MSLPETTVRQAKAARTPYVGLRPYEREERAWFFGRDRDAQFLCDKILAARLTILYSQSGLGKSSLLRAIVVPQLEESSSLVIEYDAWAHEDPARALKETLSRTASDLGVPSASAGAPTLLELVQLINSTDKRTVILVLDQFEEFLTTHGHQMDPLRKELAALVRGSRADAQVVLSLREEFLGALEPFRQEILGLFQSTYRLEPLDDSRIADAIRLPPEEFGGTCDAELVRTLIKDLKGESTSTAPETTTTSVDLPMLQLVCAQLWEEAQRSRDLHMTVRLYEKMGGAKRVLDSYVRAAMPRRWRDQLLTARMMRLLAPPSGLKLSFSAADLAANLNVDTPRVQSELERLSGARILRPRDYSSGLRYELQHDAFIRVVAPWRDQILQRASRIRQVFRALTIGAVALVVIGGPLFLNARNEQQVRRRDLVRDLVNHASSSLPSAPTLAVMLGVAAQQLAPDGDLHQLAENALRLALSTVGGVGFASQEGPEVSAVAVSSNAGKLVAGIGNAVMVWDSRQPSRPPLRLPHSRVKLSVISDDGRWLATAGTDNRILVTELGDTSAQPTPTVIDVAAPVHSLAFSAQAERLAVGIDAIGVELWALQPQPARIAQWSSPEKPEVFALTFSPDMRFLLAGTAVSRGDKSDGRVLRWDLSAPEGMNKPDRVWDESTDGYLAMAFGARGRWHAVLSLHGDVRVWDLQPGAAKKIPLFEAVQTGARPSGLVKTVAFASRGPRLALATDTTIAVWNLETVSRERVLHGHDQVVDVLAFGDDRWLASGAADGVRLWDVDHATADPTILGGGGGALVSVGYWPESRHVITNGENGALYRLDSTGRGAAQELRPKASVSADLSLHAVSASGRWLAAGSENGDLVVWERAFSDASRLAFQNQFGDAVLALAFSPDERWLAAGSADKSVKLWKLDSAREGHYARTHKGEVGTLVFSANSKSLATGSWRGDVVRWDLQAPDPGNAIELPGTTNARIKGLVFDPDDRRLAAADSNGAIRIWDTAVPGAPPLLVAGGQDITSIDDIAFTQQGRRLAIASTKGTTVVTDLWRNASSTLIDTSSAKTVSFSPDGTRLATGGFTGTVKVLDLARESSTDSLILNGPQTAIRKLSFSPDGRTLTATAGNQAYLWTVKADDLVELACRTVGRTSLPPEPCNELKRRGLNCAVCPETAPAR